MVSNHPGLTFNSHSSYRMCRCPYTVCNCTRSINVSTEPSTQFLYYSTNYATTRSDILLSEFKKAVAEAKFKQGWRLAVSTVEVVTSVEPKRERRVTRPPEIVGGGPMRRRWR